MREELFLERLKQLYYIEDSLATALPLLADITENQQLQDALMAHASQTEIHRDRLERIFEILEEDIQSLESRHFTVMLNELNSKLESVEGSDKDLLIILGGIETEHLEMGWYDGLVTLGKRLDSPEIGQLLKATRDEEEEAAKSLSNLI